MKSDFQPFCVHILAGKLIPPLPVLHTSALWKTEKEIFFSNIVVWHLFSKCT